MSYESIPDVEGGDALPSAESLIAKARKKYPEADRDEWAEFLGRLDDTMENFDPKIAIPRLGIDHFASSGDKMGGALSFLKSLLLPTLALAVTVGSAVWVARSDDPLVQMLFPYFACLLTFVASIPTIRERFLSSLSPVFDKFHMMKDGVKGRVGAVAEKGLQYLHVTEDSMSRAIVPIKERCSQATKVAFYLKQIDAGIEIPTTSSIEKPFKEYESELLGGFEDMDDAVDISRDLPDALTSREKLCMYILVPFFSVMLLLQLVVVYTSTISPPAGGDDSVMANETIVGANATEMYRFLEEENSADTTNATHVVIVEQNQCVLVWIAFGCYLLTLVQILIAYVLTQARCMAALANHFVDGAERKANKEIQDHFGHVFEQVFRTGFRKVKKDFLDILGQTLKLEEPVKKATAMVPGGEMMINFGSTFGIFQ